MNIKLGLLGRVKLRCLFDGGFGCIVGGGEVLACRVPG